jgi:hypothetical protein
LRLLALGGQCVLEFEARALGGLDRALFRFGALLCVLTLGCQRLLEFLAGAIGRLDGSLFGLDALAGLLAFARKHLLHLGAQPHRVGFLFALDFRTRRGDGLLGAALRLFMQGGDGFLSATLGFVPDRQDRLLRPPLRVIARSRDGFLGAALHLFTQRGHGFLGTPLRFVLDDLGLDRQGRLGLDLSRPARFHLSMTAGLRQGLLMPFFQRVQLSFQFGLEPRSYRINDVA